MEKQLRIGLLGLGVVGTGICQVLKAQKTKLFEQTKTSIAIKTALASPTQARKELAESCGFQLTQEPNDIFSDPEIDVVIEVIGKINPAMEFIIKAIENGKSVVTANKDLIATHGPKLQALAEKHNVCLFYEASVAGGIPILRTLSDSYLADEIFSIAGIINGTTNYMLTKMQEEQLSYEEALEQAQRLGFAESDPTNDVDGIDAAYKMVILTAFAFGMEITMEDVEVEGIRHVKSEDIANAAEFGYEIKLIGTAVKNEQQQVSISVGPVFVPKSHPLAAVKNEFNAVFVESTGIGQSMFYGPGAGGIPTATSVVSDLAAIAKNRISGTAPAFNSFYRVKSLADTRATRSSYYLLLAESSEKIPLKDWQKERLSNSGNQTAILTNALTKQELKEQLAAFEPEQIVTIMKVMEG